MSTSLSRLAVVACLVLPLSMREPAHAGAPPGPRPVDHHGDPLPRGAVARLGTLRFVHLGASLPSPSPPTARSWPAA